MTVQATTSQTVGPYFKIGLQWLYRNYLAADRVPGGRVTIQGRVLDGDGAPVPDAVLEIWQANIHGKYAHPDDPQDKPLEPGISGVWTCTCRSIGDIPVRHDQARTGAGPERQGAGPAPGDLGVHARTLETAGDTDVLSRRRTKRE